MLRHLLSLVLLLAGVLTACGGSQAKAAEEAAPGVKPGAADTAAYFPLLKGKRVAVLANHTALVDQEHLVDLLHRKGFNLTGIFSPEHGFRGTADAGEHVLSSVDEKTGIPIRSLYDGRTRHPSKEAMASFDLLVVDMQDVGVRFYTYYISMLRMMEACAEEGKTVVILDRPNPHGSEVDGPILDMARYKSGVGALPIPVLHGLTMGEIARMAIGEGWCPACRLEVIRCQNYTHSTPYVLPIAPSPNLPTAQSVALYPSLCLFEGTVLSVGRGTESPFECYGHPQLAGHKDFPHTFTPQSMPGAKEPPFKGVVCGGRSLRDKEAPRGLQLDFLVEAYRALGMGEEFFGPMFEKLIGAGWVREMILQGASADEIEARWQPEAERFRALRKTYLLYRE